MSTDTLPCRAALREALADNTVTRPDEQVAFRLDFAAWLRTRTERDQHVAAVLMLGERTMAVARQFRLTAARISQLRRDFADDWRRFCGDGPRRVAASDSGVLKKDGTFAPRKPADAAGC